MVEAYIPSAEERSNTLQQGDFLKLSGDGIFATLQGEGVSAGAPSVFLRLHGCNLKCGFGDQGWRCDAWYTWDRSTPEFWTEATNRPVDMVAAEVTAAWETAFDGETAPRLVITGGEPLLQQAKLLPLLEALPDWQIEIETNGTVSPREELRRCQINCSPKLASSGNRRRSRYRPRVLETIASFPDHWFKFVIADPTDIAEAQTLVEAHGLDYGRVLLMSEGTDAARLREREAWLQEAAASLGCLTTARNHIFWFGDKRAT